MSCVPTWWRVGPSVLGDYPRPHPDAAILRILPVKRPGCDAHVFDTFSAHENFSRGATISWARFLYEADKPPAKGRALAQVDPVSLAAHFGFARLRTLEMGRTIYNMINEILDFDRGDTLALYKRDAVLDAWSNSGPIIDRFADTCIYDWFNRNVCELRRSSQGTS